MLDQLRATCPRCQIGLMRPASLVYTVIENGQLVSVPDMPARVCDVCGNREFDRESVKRLYMMLGAARRKRTGSTRPFVESGPRTPGSPEKSRRSNRTPRPKKP